MGPFTYYVIGRNYKSNIKLKVMKKILILLISLTTLTFVSCESNYAHKLALGDPSECLNPIEKIAFHAQAQALPSLSKGDCADLIIDALHATDVDLQKLIYFEKDYYNYNPNNLMQNIQEYFGSFGTVLKHDMSADKYIPGDILFWNTTGHTGIVVKKTL